MARQIRRNDGTSVMRKIARLQSPDRMIEAGTMQQQDGWLAGIQGLPTRRQKNR